MFTRENLRNGLTVLSFIAFYLAIQPFCRAAASITPTQAQAAHLSEHPEDLPRTGDYVFGWSHSPLVSYHDERTLADEGGLITVDRSSRTHIGWLSWSSLTLAAAVGLFVAAWRLNRRAAEAAPITA